MSGFSWAYGVARYKSIIVTQKRCLVVGGKMRSRATLTYSGTISIPIKSTIHASADNACGSASQERIKDRVAGKRKEFDEPLRNRLRKNGAVVFIGTDHGKMKNIRRVRQIPTGPVRAIDTEPAVIRRIVAFFVALAQVFGPSFHFLGERNANRILIH